MSLRSNLMLAQLAIAFVRHHGVRANNGPDANTMSEADWNKLTHCLDGQPGSVRVQFRKFCDGLGADACLQQKGDALAKMAALAVKGGCGNCAEQDAMVIVVLEQLQVSRIDLMNLFPNHQVDHTFVVIGRLPNATDPAWAAAPKSNKNGSTDSDPSTWGPDAVVCDPWHDYGKAYPAAEIEQRMFRGYQSPQQNPIGGTIFPTSIWRSE
ncbi:MAG: hypothetical protein WD872_14065 [Pirellulaceae bacterium]